MPVQRPPRPEGSPGRGRHWLPLQSWPDFGLRGQPHCSLTGPAWQAPWGLVDTVDLDSTFICLDRGNNFSLGFSSIGGWKAVSYLGARRYPKGLPPTCGPGGKTGPWGWYPPLITLHQPGPHRRRGQGHMAREEPPSLCLLSVKE